MVEVRQEDREAYLAMSMLPEFDAADVRAGLWDKVTGLQAFARHRIAAENAARGDQVARLIAHMKTIEPDEETAGCPATWADFIQILEGIAEAGEPFNG